MENILERIIAVKRREVEESKRRTSIDQLKRSALFSHPCLSLSMSLRNSQTGIIAEFKRKSPSLGWIHADADPERVTRAYSQGGASGVSILTDETFFGGHLSFITLCRKGIQCPILRKDFIIDEYQLYEAKSFGADAVLLIAAVLSVEEMKALARKAHELGLETLMEVHEETELEKLNEFIDIVGVNNRNLKTFQTDIAIAVRLSELLPKNVVRVAESGIRDVSTLCYLKRHGYDGFLMGEHFMRTPDPGSSLRDFAHEAEQRMTRRLKLKVCGMRDEKNIEAVSALQPDYMGFIFYDRSPRYAGNLSPEVVHALPQSIDRVGVFVDASTEDVLAVARKYSLDSVQLHGLESPEQVCALKSSGLKIIKAIRVSDADSISLAHAYDGIADVLLFDTHTSKMGGSGHHFDWKLLDSYKGVTPFLLSGGIGEDDLNQIKEIHDDRFLGVDVNSRFELEPGVKNTESLQSFFENLNS